MQRHQQWASHQLPMPPRSTTCRLGIPSHFDRRVAPSSPPRRVDGRMRARDGARLMQSNALVPDCEGSRMGRPLLRPLRHSPASPSPISHPSNPSPHFPHLSAPRSLLSLSRCPKHARLSIALLLLVLLIPFLPSLTPPTLFDYFITQLLLRVARVFSFCSSITPSYRL